MNFKGVIFDFNGTLFFDSQKHFDAWDIMFEKYQGKKLDEDKKQEYLIGRYNEDVVKLLFPNKTLNSEESEFYSKEKEAIYRDICRAETGGCQLVDGAEELFDLLIEKNIPFTIASASIKDNMDFFIEEFKLDNWIQREHIVYDDGKLKKKSLMYKKAAEIIGVAMNDIVIFDDSASGIRGCQEVGCEKIVVVTDDEQDFKSLNGVVDTIKNFKEFINKQF